MSEIGLNTTWQNPRLPSADNLDLKFLVYVATAYSATIFSRHETAEEASKQAVRSNETAPTDEKYEACDEFDIPLTEGYFRREEERYEDMVAGLKI